jgi:hypothetical protein
MGKRYRIGRWMNKTWQAEEALNVKCDGNGKTVLAGEQPAAKSATERANSRSQRRADVRLRWHTPEDVRWRGATFIAE